MITTYPAQTLIALPFPRSAGMYMQEALDLVCRKRKLDPRNYALVLNDNGSSILIPLDRTVASLQGKRELLLVKRDNLPEIGIEAEKRAIRTTDPNGKFPLLQFLEDRVLDHCDYSIYIQTDVGRT
jgi:hypothetical protein